MRPLSDCSVERPLFSSPLTVLWSTTQQIDIGCCAISLAEDNEEDSLPGSSSLTLILMD
jgi:hypothetical protein